MNRNIRNKCNTTKVKNSMLQCTPYFGIPFMPPETESLFTDFYLGYTCLLSKFIMSFGEFSILQQLSLWLECWYWINYFRTSGIWKCVHTFCFVVLHLFCILSIPRVCAITVYVKITCKTHKLIDHSFYTECVCRIYFQVVIEHHFFFVLVFEPIAIENESSVHFNLINDDLFFPFLFIPKNWNTNRIGIEYIIVDSTSWFIWSKHIGIQSIAWF